MELAPSPCSRFSCSSYTHHYSSIPRVRTGGTSWIRAATQHSSGGGGEGAPPQRTTGRLAADGPPVVNVPADGFGAREAELAMWEKLGAVVRLSYGIGIYAGMALAGRAICDLAGIDASGGFHPSLTALVEGLGYASPPIMALLFILDDEVVKYSPHARAIRDVEDEELRTFFVGMSPWQFILVVAASSVGEELFYRAAVQGALADIFLRGTELMKDARGIVSLSGMVPPFVPFAQTFAAAITAALTGSLYYIATAPKDPTYVVTPVMRSSTGRQNMKKMFAAWYERRQMRKIYSPLLEGILAFYLGFEWIQTGNILSPMITHGIYSAVVLGHGLWKIQDHRRRLRQRIQETGNILSSMITHRIYSAVVLVHGLWKIQDHRRRLRQRIQEVRRSPDNKL